MKSKIFVLAIVLLLVVGFGSPVTRAEGESRDPQITVYVVPPVTDEKVLPDSSISPSYVSDEISVVACPGEYEPASFVIEAHEDITSLEVEATELTGEGGSIPSDNVDIRVVKCWYQGGRDLGVGCYGRYLTPELLVKDDTLVRVEDEHNYLKLTSGEYVWVSEKDDTCSGQEIVPITDRPVRDRAILQPVDIPDGANKQFWLTIAVPDGAPSGFYTGSIELRTAAGVIGELQLRLEVLPIELPEPYLTYSVFYRGRLKTTGSISSEDKNEEQFRAEIENMFDHGVTNPTILQQESETRLIEVITIRDEAGMTNKPIYYLGDTYGLGYSGLIDLAKSYGATDMYIWTKDEPTPDELDEVRQRSNAIHEAGGKAFAGLSLHFLNEEEVGSLADVLDMAVGTWDPRTSLANIYHSNNKKVYCCGNPQVVPEFPETFRRNFGLVLWQRGCDGAMDYAYQHSFDDIWNDFDCWGSCRDHVFAYPTMDGVIDTVQWEGFREGVDDVRYLTTLLNAIEEAKVNGKDASFAESWLIDLKSSDLAMKNLDNVRSEMIDHILSFQSYPTGDANQDGTVNSLDISKLERIIMGLEAPTPGADANGDGSINALDTTKIELIIVGG